jgi:hypothetical protein
MRRKDSNNSILAVSLWKLLEIENRLNFENLAQHSEFLLF